MNRKEIIRYAADELIGKGNIAIISKFFTPDYAAHAGDKEYRGHEFIKQFIKQVHDSIPDIHVVSVEFLAEDRNKIVWQRTLKGTHKHNLQGIPASGKKVKWVELSPVSGMK